MKTLDHFSVQPVDDMDNREGHCIHVEAMGPVQAAELALGETLVNHGDPASIRAIVWRLGDDFMPISIKLYRSSDMTTPVCEPSTV